MNKYDLLETIKETIQKIENYPDSGYMYAHLVGILSVYVSEKQLEKILHDLTNELEIKEMSDELKYEMRAGK